MGNNAPETDKTTEVKTLFYCWSDALRRFADINGRTTKYEFWSFQTASVLIFVVLSGFAVIFDAHHTIFEIYGLYFIIPFITSCVRRLHDSGRSGKYMLPLIFLLVFALINLEYDLTNTYLTIFLLLSYISYLFPFLAADGEEFENQYGKTIIEAKFYNFYGT